MQHATENIMQPSPAAQAESALSRLAACVDACFECAQSCTACAGACMGEPMIGSLEQCVRLNEDCADFCIATARVTSRLGRGVSAALGRTLALACAAACAACAVECEKHAKMHEHCRVCAEACRRREVACMALLASCKADTESVAQSATVQGWSVDDHLSARGAGESCDSL